MLVLRGSPLHHGEQELIGIISEEEQEILLLLMDQVRQRIDRDLAHQGIMSPVL
jgi:hypothetical protein